MGQTAHATRGAAGGPVEGTPMDAIERDKIDNARRMTPEQKLRAGLELFDLNRALIMGILKADHPDAAAATLHQMYLNRMDLVRRLERC
jgi:hypothetical protein